MADKRLYINKKHGRIINLAFVALKKQIGAEKKVCKKKKQWLEWSRLQADETALMELDKKISDAITR